MSERSERNLGKGAAADGAAVCCFARLREVSFAVFRQDRQAGVGQGDRGNAIGGSSPENGTAVGAQRGPTHPLRAPQRLKTKDSRSGQTTATFRSCSSLPSSDTADRASLSPTGRGEKRTSSTS